jgi:hypothetical protein
MSAVELLLWKQSFDPSDLSFNVEQQEQHRDDEAMDNYILDTLKLGHQDEQSTE